MRKGFTLVEILVYLALFILLSGVVINVLITATRSFADARVIRALASSGMALERIVRETRAAGSIDLAGSVFDVHPGKLKLNSLDDAGNPKTLEFYLDGDALKLKENGAVSGPLTSANLEVTNLIFRTASSPRAAVVKIELSARDQRDRRARVENFSASALFRGSY